MFHESILLIPGETRKVPADRFYKRRPSEFVTTL
jgi:hypothetical protein